jgi:3-dehydroquinate synthase
MVEVLKSQGHPVYIGNESTADLERIVDQPCYETSKIFILVDENTHQHCLPKLLVQIERLTKAEIIEIESGEQNKNIGICTHIWEALTELKADRKSLFINLGGGVICDMGAFIASTFKRGLDFINIPTTLLSQVDASVGGKTGIDLNNIKNQIGLFSLPQAVFVWPDFLETLPQEQILSGFAEMVKHALIADENYWAVIQKVDRPDAGLLESLIQKSIEIKNNVVQQDPTEKGLRKILNFGHTIGHAIESLSLEKDVKPLLHGEAIAIGMICESYLSLKKMNFPEAKFKTVVDFIKNTFPSYFIDPSTYPALLEMMGNDKKNEQQQINFALLQDIGVPALNVFCETTEITDALDFYSRLNTL